MDRSTSRRLSHRRATRALARRSKFVASLLLLLAVLQYTSADATPLPAGGPRARGPCPSAASLRVLWRVLAAVAGTLGVLVMVCAARPPRPNEVAVRVCAAGALLAALIFFAFFATVPAACGKRAAGPRPPYLAAVSVAALVAVAGLLSSFRVCAPRARARRPSRRGRSGARLQAVRAVGALRSRTRANLAARVAAPMPATQAARFRAATCSVCLDDMGEGWLARLRCGHVFHAACIRQVVLSAGGEVPGCPNCRTSVEGGPLST